MQQARTKSSIKNMVFSIVLFAFELVLKFAARTIFIKVLAVELLGLNGLFSNILQVLSLTELGIGSALTFSMYKPMAEENEEKLVALYKLYKKIYLIIISIILIAGIAITPFLKHLISGDAPDYINLYIVYLIYLFNTAVSYLSAHKKSLLLAAQRQDLSYKSEIIKTLFLYVSQVIVLLLFKNYYVYVIFLPLSTILDYIIVSMIVKKKFVTIACNKTKPQVDTETKNEIKTNTFALIFHKLGGTVVSSTDNILISALLGLTVLGIYSNYLLIVSSLIVFINSILNSLKGSIGNLIAKEDCSDIESTYDKLNFIYTWLVIIFTVCLGCLLQPFMILWVGEDYLFSEATMLLIVLSFYLNISKYMTYSFKECAGLLTQDKYRPVAETIINLIVSIVLGKLIGINGIVIGTIVCTITGPIITEGYVLYKHLFKKPVLKFYLRYLLNTLMTFVIFAITYYTCSLIEGFGFGYLILKLLICCTVPNILMLIFNCRTKVFKDSFAWVKNTIKRK